MQWNMPTQGKINSDLSNRCFAFFASTDPNNFLHLAYEYFPVADLAGFGLFHDRGHDSFRHTVRDDQFKSLSSG